MVIKFWDRLLIQLGYFEIFVYSEICIFGQVIFKKVCFRNNCGFFFFIFFKFDIMDLQFVDGYVQSVKIMLEMMWLQVVGIFLGNYGFFYKYYIEVVILQGIRRKNSNYVFLLERIGRQLEIYLFIVLINNDIFVKSLSFN